MLRAMNDAVASQLVDEFAETLQLGDSDEDRSSHGLILRALRALPDPQAWTYGSNEGQEAPPIALLLAGERLFHVEAGREDGGPVRVFCLSRSLIDPSPVIELEWGDRTEDDEGEHYRTIWRFRFADDTSTTVIGTVQTKPSEELDPAERFARAVAATINDIVQ
jgi:hypothetical protein